MSWLKIQDLKTGEIIHESGVEPEEIKAVESWSVVDNERIRHVEIAGGYTPFAGTNIVDKEFQKQVIKIAKQIKAAKCLI